MAVRTSVGGESGLHLTPSEFCAKILSTTEETMESLHDIWREAGYEDIECRGLLGDFLTKYKNICAKELESEKCILQHAKETVSKKFTHLQNLYSQLGRDEICPKSTTIMGENITDQLSTLEKLTNEINVDVEARQGLMTIEVDAIDVIVNEIGEEGPGEEIFKQCEDTPKLSDDRLNVLKECRKTFEEMKIKRENDMKELAKTCYQYIIDMKIDEEGWLTLPDYENFGTMDEAVLSYGKDDEFKLKLHKTEFERLTSRSKGLLQEKERRRDLLASIGGDIARLWTLLRTPVEEREEFQSSFQMNLSMETLSRGQDELDRLKALRLESLGDVIENIRGDIESLWCDVGIEAQELREQEFPLFYASLEDLSEAMLEEHEDYHKTLKERVDVLRPLLQKVSKRESIVRERFELEKIQMNPERLTARGPKAREDRKKEEQMQARVKQLEKLTKELNNQIQTWENANNSAFMFAGERYTERITTQDKEYKEYRDSLRSARKRKDGKADIAAAIEKAKAPRRITTSAPSNLTGGFGSSSIKESSRPNKIAKTSKRSSACTTVISDKNVAEVENLSSGDRNSMSSQMTIQTSATEVKARESSATLVRESLADSVE